MMVGIFSEDEVDLKATFGAKSKYARQQRKHQNTMILKILVENSPLEYNYCSKTGRVYNVTPRKEIKFEIFPWMVKSCMDNSSIVYWNEQKEAIEKIVHKTVRELLRDEIKALTEALDEDRIPDESCTRKVECTLKEGEKEVTVKKFIDVNSVLIYKQSTFDGDITTYYLEYDTKIECMLVELFNMFERKR